MSSRWPCQRPTRGYEAGTPAASAPPRFSGRAAVPPPSESLPHPRVHVDHTRHWSSLLLAAAVSSSAAFIVWYSDSEFALGSRGLIVSAADVVAVSRRVVCEGRSASFAAGSSRAQMARSPPRCVRRTRPDLRPFLVSQSPSVWRLLLSRSAGALRVPSVLDATTLLGTSSLDWLTGILRSPFPGIPAVFGIGPSDEAAPDEPHGRAAAQQIRPHREDFMSRPIALKTLTTPPPSAITDRIRVTKGRRRRVTVRHSEPTCR